MLPPCFWAPPYVVCNKITKTATADPSPRRLNLRPSLPSRPTNKCRWVGHRVGRARNAGKARPDRPRKAGTASRRDTHTWRGRRSSQGCPACAATSSYGRRCYAQRSLVHLTPPPSLSLLRDQIHLLQCHPDHHTRLRPPSLLSHGFHQEDIIVQPHYMISIPTADLTFLL